MTLLMQTQGYGQSMAWAKQATKCRYRCLTHLGKGPSPSLRTRNYQTMEALKTSKLSGWLRQLTAPAECRVSPGETIGGGQTLQGQMRRWSISPWSMCRCADVFTNHRDDGSRPVPSTGSIKGLRGESGLLGMKMWNMVEQERWAR